MVLGFTESFCLQSELGSLAESFSNARLIGQEKDSSILFSWVAQSSTDSGRKATFVGLKDYTNGKSSIIYEHPSVIDIVGASVNPEKNLLAFTELASGLREYSEAGIGDKIYRSFVSEINPRGRCFCLQIDRPEFQRVQFLYPIGPHAKERRRESYLLYLLHRECIGLYTFRFSHLPGHNGLVIVRQPLKREISKAFYWYQWDPSHQRLYALYFMPSATGRKVEPHLRCFEFPSKDTDEIVMDWVLPLPFTEEQLTEEKPEYLPLPAFRKLQESHINLSVVSLPGDSQNGSLYICYQHPVQKDGSSSPDKNTQFLTYSVCLLHLGQVLKVKVKSIEVDKESDKRLYFSSISDHVLVYVPGVLLHLLDCSAEHSPVHHILMHGDVVPRFPASEPLLCNWTNVNGYVKRRNVSVLDASTWKGYDVVFSRSVIAQHFSETHLTSTKLALLHMALVHLNDRLLIRMLFREMCLDPAHPDCKELLCDFLLGSTYARMKFSSADSSLLKLLPLTLSGRLRGHLEKDVDGKDVAVVTYSSVSGDSIERCLARSNWGELSQEKSVVRIKNYTDHTNPFEVLLANLKLNKQQTPRVDLERLDDLGDVDIDVEEKTDADGKPKRPSLFRRLSVSFASRLGKKDADLRLPPDALESEDVELERQQKKLIYYVQKHLMRWLKGDAKTLDIRCLKIAKEYCSIQADQAKMLLDLICTTLGFDDTHLAVVSLAERGTERDCALYGMVERFCCALEQLGFPYPKGFHVFFASLGYRCLEPRVFLQYVNRQVFQLKEEFVRRVITELGSSAECLEIKFQLLSRLKPDEETSRLLVSCSESNHMDIAQFMAQKRVASLLSLVPEESGNNAFEGQASFFYDRVSGSPKFPPAQELMKRLYDTEEKLQGKQKRSASPADSLSLNFIERNCLSKVAPTTNAV
ncbi:protein pigeon-like [Oscarella lobularis]|uniref:protein pigeon-like n=1 Tax=Oscarella lobularis TaxID=121494 RepID=UPI003313EEA0